MTGKYAVGDEIEGEVTGVVDFGAFVKIEDNLEASYTFLKLTGLWSRIRAHI